MQDGAAPLHPAIVPPADDLAAVYQDRAGRDAASMDNRATDKGGGIAFRALDQA